ncbi:serine/threonine-protein kinase, partial [Angustibacter peucedani]
MPLDDAPTATRDPGAPAVPGYRLTRRLGRGASATVWRAEPASGGRPVAVKVVRAGPQAERELAVLTGVRHPHVLALLEVVVLDDEQVALVVPLLDGGTLGGLVAARGPLRAGEVVTCLAPLAAAVGELHAQGVQHGDLAPGNVLLDASGRPFLADLGTVRVTGEPRDEVYGTPGFVDPVVLTGGAPTPASDVHGLGALAWFALTGAPPPGVPSREPLAGLVAPHVPAALVDLVEQAVHPDPHRRPTPHELARGLHEAAVAVPVWRSGRAPGDGGLTQRVDGAVR